MRSWLGVLVAGFVLGGASPAFASSVTNLSVTTPTTNAVGARTDYRIGFTATTALPQSGTITLTFPTGTTFAGYNRASVLLGATPVGTCGNANGLAITCTLFAGSSITAGAAVTVTLGGVTNPPARGPVHPEKNAHPDKATPPRTPPT